MQSYFYVDDSIFVFQSRDELHESINILNRHFAWFGLTMHLGSNTTKLKSDAIFFPASLKEAILQTHPAEDVILPNDGRI